MLFQKNIHVKSKMLVYKFVCKLCTNRLESYIGRTSRTIAERYREHSDSLIKQSNKSALSEHWIKHHQGEHPSMSHFEFHIVRVLQRPILSDIVEAQEIEKWQPTMNRKHEVSIL